MSVDIEKLRALHAATTQGEWTWLRAYASGAHVVASGNTGVANVLSRENPVHGWHAAGQAKCDANAAFIAAIHESVLPLCDRVERADAEIERLRAENARLAGELAALRGTARPAGGPGRCTVCGWLLAESRDKGCVEGDCWYRPWGGA